ncbi:REP element-mobilizing transposase RayT [Epilithonimonas bovis DSM 19482]|uniref:REP element-mobilizing transposase RayT n=1 Tax=Epilithonimonas bovis DSM 19482 TaxID=1121284 RepID=A0A1U7PVX0_9FLAO|nr:transposase [Epilithonimonas bovis]SIT97706.1 REP element-mobilizing transposase RayT [Epilithonimonas bovis DSM 19482]
MSLFRNKYRIPSARWQNWDYRNAGAYFITICTKDRLCFFGNVQDNKMQLSDAGILAEKYWKEIPGHFKNAQLGEFVVMPNHIHGIVILTDLVGTLHCNVSIESPEINQFMSDISPKPGSVSTIIRSYKSVCTKNINLQNPVLNFAWQSRFHDRVIRDEMEYQRIANYIIHNPENWGNDKFFF